MMTWELANNDLVLENLFAKLKVEELKVCRRVCRRWEVLATSALLQVGLSTPSQILVELDDGRWKKKSSSSYTQVAHFLGSHGIPHILAISLRDSPWSKEDLYDDETRSTQVHLHHPSFTSENKYLSVSQIIVRKSSSSWTSSTLLVRELHLEMVLRTRKDLKCMWTILKQFPCTPFLSLTFPIILYDVLPHPAEPSKKNVEPPCECVKALSIRNTQVESSGLCIRSWGYFLKHFPALESLHLDPGYHLCPAVDLSVTTLLEELGVSGNTFLPHLSTLRWSFPPDTPDTWSVINDLASQLRYLELVGTDSPDAMFYKLGADIKVNLEALKFSSYTLGPGGFDLELGLRDSWTNLTNLTLAWWSFGWEEDNNTEFYVHGLQSIFETDQFALLFPSLTTLTFVPLEKDRSRYDRVWDSLFGGDGDGTRTRYFPKIQRLGVPLGYRSGCQERRLGQIPLHFPNLLALKHWTLKEKDRTQQGQEDEEELWVCRHVFAAHSSSSDAPEVKKVEGLVALVQCEDLDNELSWYHRHGCVTAREAMVSLGFPEGAEPLQHTWAHQTPRPYRNRERSNRRLRSTCNVA